MADHNDPNAVNSIFSDIDISAADLYDIFGFPSAEAVRWARKDIALRRNFSTLAALAWVLYRAAEFAQAHETID